MRRALRHCHGGSVVTGETWAVSVSAVNALSALPCGSRLNDGVGRGRRYFPDQIADYPAAQPLAIPGYNLAP